jgi:hypothetical protein
VTGNAVRAASLWNILFTRLSLSFWQAATLGLLQSYCPQNVVITQPAYGPSSTARRSHLRSGRLMCGRRERRPATRRDAAHRMA